MRVKKADYSVDFDSTPYSPKDWDWEVWEGDQVCARVAGKWEFDQKAVGSHLVRDCEPQTLCSADFRRMLGDKVFYGAQLLDFYLQHQYLIPKEYKQQPVVFLGTIYRDLYPNSPVLLCARYLVWDKKSNSWGWGYLWMDSPFVRSYLVLVSVPPGLHRRYGVFLFSEKC